MNEIELLPPAPIEALERAQIDMQIATARKYPRVLSKVKAEMLSFATLDEDTAASCFYTLPRGGKQIQGPSVRLAEIAASCYGNIRAASRIVSEVTSGENPHVVVQSVAHDLEKNVAFSIEKRRAITAKKNRETGERLPIASDDVNLAVNACSSIALRDALLKTIPKALIQPVFEQVKRVALGNVSSLAAKRLKVVERLQQMGVPTERIFAAVSARKIDDIGMDQMETLIGLGTSIKDGELTLEQAFPEPVEQPKFEPPVQETNPQPRRGRPPKTKTMQEGTAVAQNATSLQPDDKSATTIPPETPTPPEAIYAQAQAMPGPEAMRAELCTLMNRHQIDFDLLQRWMVNHSFALNAELFTCVDDMADGTVKRLVLTWPRILTDLSGNAGTKLPK